MKTFRMKADVTFDAENIDDAFAQLSRHFAMIGGEVEEEAFFTSGKITIEPDVPGGEPEEGGNP
jgi:hypothetical protein